MNRLILLTLLTVVFTGWSSCKKDEPLPLPEACLSLEQVAVSAGDTVIVTDCSKDAAHIEVQFGEQSLISKTDVSKYVYWKPGTYTIKLLAYPLDPKDDISVASQQITVLSGNGGDGGAATACFEYRNQLNLEVFFINCSENSTRYEWDFGDGSTGTEVNPKHTYASAGSYKVALKSYSIGAAEPVVTEQDVVVEEIGNPVACFSPENILVGPNETFELINCSENSFRFEWDFEDDTKTTVLNPSHSYASSGNYTIKLKAYSADGTFFDEAEGTVKVGDKYVTGFILTDFPDENDGGETWDIEFPFPLPIDGIGPDPDIQLTYKGANGQGQTDISYDIESGDLPLQWKVSPSIKFSDDTWEITMIDDDGVLGTEEMATFSGSLSDYVEDGKIILEFEGFELEVLFEIR